MLTNRFRRVPAWLAGAVTLATWLGACGDSTTGFDELGGSSGHGASSGWTFVPPGAGATTSSGGKPGTAGTPSGGQSGKAGSAGAGTGGMPSKPVTFQCMRQVPSQPLITSFDGYEGDRWQSPGNVDGGGYAYPDSLKLSMADFLGTEGQVEDYSGIGVWFSGCIDASKFKGVRLTISGSVGSTDHVNFFLITNRTKEVNEADGVGECVPEDPDDAWGSCRPPRVSLPVSGSPTTHSIPWTAFDGGLPDDKTDGSDIIALQWSFEWDEVNDYAAQLAIDDLSFFTDAPDPGGGGSGGGGGGGGGAGGGSGGSGGSAGGGGSGGTASGAAGAPEGGTDSSVD